MVKKSPKKESPQSVGSLDPEMRALGMIETRGLVACIEAADAMAKAANIALTERRAIGGGYMTVYLAETNEFSVVEFGMQAPLDASEKAARQDCTF